MAQGEYEAFAELLQAYLSRRLVEVDAKLAAHGIVVEPDVPEAQEEPEEPGT